MSLSTVERIAPEAFDQAKHDAVALRQAAMKKLVDDLWRVMTTPYSPLHASPIVKSDKPCATC